MDISLIMPFRERVEQFYNLMNSLIATTDDRTKIEIICATDSDDPILTEEKKQQLIYEYSDFNLTFYTTERSEHFIRDYWNPIARMAKGRWIMAINDDALFMTKGWDTIINHKMSEWASKKGDDLVYGLTKDGINRIGENPKYPNFSCWCLQSKEHVDVLGWFYFPKLAVWGPDHFAADLYRYVEQRLAGCRLVSLVEVFIDHISVHTNKSDDWSNFNRMREIDTKTQYTYTRLDIQEQGEVLVKYIRNGRRK